MIKEIKDKYIIYSADADKVFIDVNLDLNDVLNYTSSKKIFMAINNDTINNYREISIEDDIKYKALREEEIKKQMGIK